MKKHELRGHWKKNIWPMLSVGIIRPLIYKTFSLKEAALAHEMMESSKRKGKIVLIVKTSN